MNRRIELRQYQAKVSRSPKENIPEDPCLRIYNHSPDRVCLQIRCEKSYASTTLDIAQIKALAVALKVSLDQMAGAEKKDCFDLVFKLDLGPPLANDELLKIVENPMAVDLK